jgi:threonine/homoserine/homoserine lactone efflux protein
MLPLLLAFWAAFGLALISPGPNFAVMLSTALSQGRAAAVWVALGVAIGEAAWGFAAVFGVAALAQQHPWIALALRIGGGLFLLRLAFLSLRAAWRGDHAAGRTPEASDGAAPLRGGIGRGLALMLLNAKAGVFWISLAGLFLAHGTPVAVGVTAVAGAVVLSLAWHLTLALALSAGAVVRLYRRLQRGIEAALGVILGGLGLRLLLA